MNKIAEYSSVSQSNYPLFGRKENMSNHISTSFNLFFYCKKMIYHFVLNNSVFYKIIFLLL